MQRCSRRRAARGRCIPPFLCCPLATHGGPNSRHADCNSLCSSTLHSQQRIAVHATTTSRQLGVCSFSQGGDYIMQIQYKIN
eukprot:3883926-Prymnesium_polylepis.1